MDFRRGSQRDEPEINLVPMIDVLLVIVIFLVVTTTYARFSELQINLPTAEANQSSDRPNQINVAVSANGQYVIDKNPLAANDANTISVELKRAARGNPDPMIVINADANATHQSVINVMEAARLDGFNRITFTTQQPTR